MSELEKKVKKLNNDINKKAEELAFLKQQKQILLEEFRLSIGLDQMDIMARMDRVEKAFKKLKREAKQLDNYSRELLKEIAG